ncbi:MAG: hypothetical protein IT539_03605 [Bradyrhizobiaceae bacterium]|nr:hypothetical protein [Bradyrhizobiaceae bacterium]
MAQEITAVALTTCELASDGSRVRLNVTDAEGNPATLSIPSDCLNQLTMTLPRLMQLVLQARFRDENMRVVFLASHWKLQRSGTSHHFILTLKTTHGFEASFGFSERDLRSLAGELFDRAANPQESQPSLN